MDLKAFCEGIGLNKGAQQLLYDFKMDEATYLKYKQQFFDDRFRFFEMVKMQMANYRPLFLYVYVRLAMDAYEEYRIRGIEDEVFFDTFSDIETWCSICAQEFGEYGIEEYNWLQEHVQLRLFRLGRLQFQPFVFDRELEVAGTKIYNRQIVLNVHIPSEAPLSPLLVEDSFERARRFFRGITPIFVCHSWLMYPMLADILKQDSNILQFQKHFFVFDVNQEATQAEERIFNELHDDKTQYREDTSLQRNAKAYLLAGNKLGSGYGIKI